MQEEAFYVLDIGDIVRKHKEWKLKLPKVEPHYAVKCNDSMMVLEVLNSLGTSFDCASKAEIAKVLQLGADPGKIIFANPVKQASHVRYAANTGVTTMTFDNETELHKIKSLYPSAKLVIRIRCDATAAQCPLGMKFGVEVDEAPSLLEAAYALGLDVIGVSFHVGSGCSDAPVFNRAIRAAKDLFEDAKRIGFDFSLLDIGGGFPGNKGSSIDKIADVVNSALDEYFPDECGVRVIAEPGRFYVASAYTLATLIHSKRQVKNEGGTYSYMYYINDGVYGSFNCLLYDHAVVTPIPLKDTVNMKKQALGTIWGPTCDGLDQVTGPLMLPEMEIGEWFVFQNMGAYTLPVASTFNGMPVPKVHAVANESTILMLRDMCNLNKDEFGTSNLSNDLLAGLNLSEPNRFLSDQQSNSSSLASFPLSFSSDSYMDDFVEPVN
ncbi:ornithine decarboxylase-like isoform X2 [Neocloeon triangulifer]|nr:ornithine decarboxylase-like isoform X2 [Neocloeon triangulifer]